jgi:hypothetical protein
MGGVSGDGWSCSYAGGSVACTLASLSLGVAPSIAITVTAPEDGGTITNTATVSGYEIDLDLRDNTTSAGTLVKSVYHLYLPVVLR